MAWPAKASGGKGAWFGVDLETGKLLARVPGVIDFDEQVQHMSHPILKKRIARVLECKAYYGVNLWMIHAFKNNKTYAFMEVNSILEEKPGLALKLIDLIAQGKQICFFIGTYPNYWSRKDNMLRWVNQFPSPPDPLNFWAFGTTPFIPGVDMGIFKQLDPGRWEYYVSAENIKIYKAQKLTLEYQAAWQKECLRKNYPREELKPKRIVQTPKGPGTYDLPMSELTPPAIDMPEQTEADVAAGAFPRPRLFLTFWQVNQDTLGLIVDSPAG